MIEREPTLTIFGFRYRHDGYTDTDCAAFQQRLLDSAELCTRICGWLGDVQTTVRMNLSAGSYGLKQGL